MILSANSQTLLRSASLAISLLLISGSAHAVAPTVNGLFYGDGDAANYTLLASNGDERGDLYYSVVDDVLYLAVVMNRTVNDNVFGDQQADATYLANAGWTGPYHKARDLVQSDHVEILLSCGNNSWTWKQDLLYDADSDDDPAESDWLSDALGPDGDGTPPPGLVTASSMQWNMNNTTWDVTLNGTRNTLNDWKSPDDGSNDPASLGYPTFDAANQWEWPVVYEMAVEVEGCSENGFFVEIVSAHNSPSKDGDPDVRITLVDLGDAPEPNYPTLLANDGASHVIVPGYFLGERVDAEGDGAPTSEAIGDDNLFTDDEDGIAFLTDLVAGEEATIEVRASGAGKLDAWVDFNADNDWDDLGEQVFNSADISPGTTQLNITVPDNADYSQTYARFRFSSAGGLSYVGQAADGEVEDYKVTVYPVPIELSALSARATNGAVELAWTTQSEEENLGFRVYRAEGEDDNYRLLNDQLIPGAGTTRSVNSYSYRDETVEGGTTYFYKVSDVSFAGDEEFHGPVRVPVPGNGEVLALTLNAPAPNPVREASDIKYSLPAATDGRLVLYDVTGRERRVVAEGQMEPGVHTARLDRSMYGERLTSGVYLMRLETQLGNRTQRVILSD